MDDCFIIQHGIDGFGHQLYGLFTLLILHGVMNYKFDGHAFINKKFQYQHIHGKVANDVMEYTKEAIRSFIISENQSFINRKLIQMPSHNMNDKFLKSNTLTTYHLDNCFIFDTSSLSEENSKRYYQNIKTYKDFFINRKLPSSSLEKNNIVIHIRQGDAMHTERRKSLVDYNSSLIKLVTKLNIKYPNHVYYIHSDGNVNFLTKKLEELGVKYIFKPKNTHILEVLSDFTYSKIFVCGNSALSKVACFFGEKELTLIHDDNNLLVPENIIKISDYMSSS